MLRQLMYFRHGDALFVQVDIKHTQILRGEQTQQIDGNGHGTTSKIYRMNGWNRLKG